MAEGDGEIFPKINKIGSALVHTILTLTYEAENFFNLIYCRLHRMTFSNLMNIPSLVLLQD